MLVVLIVGLLLNAVVLPLAARRVWFLYRVVTSGQPAPDRVENVTGKIGAALKSQVVEVFGQRKLLKWSIPGVAHFFVFWAFVILGTVYLEAYAVLLTRDPEWSWFVFGNWAFLGFLQDFIAVMCLLGIGTFWWIRIVNNPANQGRGSRFFGSHLGPAYFTLLMIFNVIWTLFLFRGAVEARDMGTSHGYGKAAFVSYALGTVLPDSTVLIGIGLLLHIGVMLAFLIFVLNSKHLHIFVAPLNVLFGRKPVALGAAKPMTIAGKPVTLDDIEDLDEDATLGVGKAEDFTWKGILDFATCTECGRCQSQCPAWNTEKPLSPKLMIMALRDHAMAKAPYVLAGEGDREAVLAKDPAVAKEVERPLVGDTGDDWFYMPEDGSAVIDPDVLWSCTTCGACVNQCPVDIEHVDHILDMRRYQVLVENNFPAELNQLFRGMEGKGNPWNLSATARMDWAKGLDFEVPVVGEDIESLESVDWLFWVGCAGAYEDRAKKTTRAVAELLNIAGISFGVLGNGETCTGDSARRAGNEFVYQGLAQQNVETLKEYKAKTVVSTCAHCFNTLKNEYRDFGLELEVVHHTQLLNRLVREGKLTPMKDGAGAASRKITYHDPCYLGRHNQVYEPPRELLQVLPGASYVEMERSAERSFCCGAGGARMWMEENLGERINVNRTAEAVATGADQIAVGCPFCRVMLADGLTAQQADGKAREEVEVLDVAQMLLASVKGESATRARADAPASAPAEPSQDVATQAEPEPGDVTQTEDTVTDTEEVGPAAKASGGGSSLFDLGSDESSDDEGDTAGDRTDTSGDRAESRSEEPAATSGGSLFDLGSDDTSDEPDTSGEGAKSRSEEATAEPTPSKTESDTDLGSAGSLFDLGSDEEPTASEPEPETAPEPEAKPEPEATVESEPEPSGDETDASDDRAGTSGDRAESRSEASTQPAQEIPESGSLFDIAAPEPETTPAPEAKAEPEPGPEPEAEPEPEPEPEASAESEPEPEPEATAESEPDASGDRAESRSEEASAQPATEIPESGSLFDIAAPEPEPASESDPEPAVSEASDPEPEPDPEPAAEPETPAEASEPEPEAPAEAESPAESEATETPASDDDRVSGADLTAMATFAASDDEEEAPAEAPADQAPTDEAPAEQANVEETTEPETEAETDAEDTTGEPAETEQDEKPAASSSEPGHQPRTDVDINESGSLFDL